MPESKPLPAAEAELPVRLAIAVLRNGAPAHTAEDAMARAAVGIGVPVQAILGPTRTAAVIGPPVQQQVLLTSYAGGGTNVARLAALAALRDGLAARTLTAAEGVARLAAIEATRSPYGWPATVANAGLLSFASAILLGGGWRELAIATVAGVAAALVLAAIGRLRPALPLAELHAAAIATLAGILTAHLLGAFSATIAIAAGLISIYPGYALFLGIAEIARGRSGAGLDRLVGALVTLFALGGGVAVGGAFAGLFPGLQTTASPSPLPTWMQMVAYPAYIVSLYVGMNARPRDLPWLAVSLLLAAGGVAAGAVFPNGDVATYVTATVVGAAGQLGARWVGLPGSLLSLPGVRYLLPGSLAFRGVLQLLVKDVATGIDFAFQVLLTLVLILAGLITAQVLFAPRDGPRE